MIGRAAVSQPGLVDEIVNGCEPLGWADIKQAQLKFLAEMSGNELGIVGRYKQWLAMTALHYPEAAADFALIKRLKHRKAVFDLMAL
jgi:tRNA-dihydrouridine synthase C